MVAPYLGEQCLKGKHREDINNGGMNIRFVILDCHFCHQDWCNFAENNSDFMSSQTNRALKFHSMLGGGGIVFLFQIVTAKKNFTSSSDEDNTFNIS